MLPLTLRHWLLSCGCLSVCCRHCEEVSLFTNWQEIRIQEHSQASASTGSPKALAVLPQDDLADACQVGGERARLAVSMPGWR